MASDENTIASLDETVTKILSIFYPDKEFLSLLLTNQSDESFVSSLTKWMNSNSKLYDTSNPFNKFYGIVQTKPSRINYSFPLNKENTDALFSFVKSESDNGEIELKESINDAFELYNIDEICFVNDKDTNKSTSLPVNFYSFALTLRILIQFYENQINSFSFGIFENLFTFDENKEEIFYQDLYCSYLLFLYYFEKRRKINSTLKVTISNDTSIYNAFTYHIIEISKAKEQLSSKFRLDVIQMMSLFLKSLLTKVILKMSNNIQKTTIAKICKLLQSDNLNISYIDIHGPNIFFQSFDLSTVNISSVNIHLLSKGEIKMPSKGKSNNLRFLSIEGNNAQFRADPSSMSKLLKFSYITNRITMEIISFNEMKYIRSLTLKSINYAQFNELILISGFTSLYDIDLEISDNIESTLMLLAINNFLTEDNFNKLGMLKICIKNQLLQLSKENGYYFIQTVLDKLPKCSFFTLTNHSQFEIGSDSSKKISKDFSIHFLPNSQYYQNEFDMITHINTFGLNENDMKPDIIQKKKKYFDMTHYYSLMVCIEKKYNRLKKKPLLVLIANFLCQPIGQIYLVGNFVD